MHKKNYADKELFDLIDELKEKAKIIHIKIKYDRGIELIREEKKLVKKKKIVLETRLDPNNVSPDVRLYYKKRGIQLKTVGSYFGKRELRMSNHEKEEMRSLCDPLLEDINIAKQERYFEKRAKEYLNVSYFKTIYHNFFDKYRPPKNRKYNLRIP